jgi:hypothetical protein
LSFYGDTTLTARLRMNATALGLARGELLSRDLIAHAPPLTQPNFPSWTTKSTSWKFFRTADSRIFRGL